MLDIGQTSDSDCEEVQLQEEQDFLDTADEQEAVGSVHPTAVVSESTLTQIFDPTYNYSLDSREYVLVSSLSYTGGSASTTLTTVAAGHHEDSSA